MSDNNNNNNNSNNNKRTLCLLGHVVPLGGVAQALLLRLRHEASQHEV